MTKDTLNRIALMFPSLSNQAVEVKDQVTEAPENTNTLSTEALWQGLSERFVLAAKKILAPLDNIHVDIMSDLELGPNPDALPVVQIEVTQTGDAIKDCTNWDQTNITSTYVPCQVHRFSVPFKLSSYDLQRGERVESKIAAAVESACQGVLKELMDTIEDAVDPSYISSFGPAAAAAMSGAFTSDETHVLFANPAAYASIVPTDKLGLDLTEGAYGINHLHKSAIMPEDTDVLIATKDAIHGAIATPAVLENHAGTGMDVRQIGSVNGCPLVLKTQFDWNEQLKCSVEVMAGFVVTREDGLVRYTIGEEPTPSNFGNGPEEI